MNKKEMVKLIATEVEKPQQEVEAIINKFHELIVAEVAKGERISFVGFGTFEPRKRAARVGHNPQDGKAIKIAAKTVPVFKAGKTFKEKVNVKPAKKKKK